MLNEVKIALSNVPKIYLEYPTKNGNKNDERAFAYEFYHQLRSNVLSEIYITGETRKRVPCVLGKSEFDVKPKKISNSKRPRRVKPKFDEDLIPDILIHVFNSDEKNEVAIELKVSRGLSLKEIYDDLNKLVRLTGEPRKYKKGIFIAANCDLTNIINKKIAPKDIKNKHYKEAVLNIIENNKKIVVWNVVVDFSYDLSESSYQWEADKIDEKNIRTVGVENDIENNEVIRIVDFQ